MLPIPSSTQNCIYCTQKVTMCVCVSIRRENGNSFSLRRLGVAFVCNQFWVATARCCPPAGIVEWDGSGFLCVCLFR